jgi:hypothetical protein
MIDSLFIGFKRNSADWKRQRWRARIHISREHSFCAGHGAREGEIA